MAQGSHGDSVQKWNGFSDLTVRWLLDVIWPLRKAAALSGYKIPRLLLDLLFVASGKLCSFDCLQATVDTRK